MVQCIGSKYKKPSPSLVKDFNYYNHFNFIFFRFDEDIGRVELDYPRDMAMWKGVGYNIDSVFQWKDGKIK